METNKQDIINTDNLESKLNIDNESITVSENTNKLYNDIFSDTLTEAQNMAAVQGYKNNFDKTLKSLGLERDIAAETYNRFKLFGKELDELSDSQINILFDKLEFTENQEGKSAKEIQEFKRAIIGLLISSEESYKIYDEAEKEFSDIQKEFNSEIDELLASLNLQAKIAEMQEDIDKEPDEEVKKKKQEILNGLIISSNLNIFIDKIKNKGYKTLKKEIKKNYDKVYNDLYKTLGRDFTNSYQQIKGLDVVLFNIFPNNEEKIKILLYTIFRYLIKNTITISYLKKDEVKKCEGDKFITNVTLDRKLSTFLNYFILGIVKMTKESFDKEQSDLYQSIQKYLQMEF